MSNNLVFALVVGSLCVSGRADFCEPSNTSCWPTASEWDDLNNTVGGRLVDMQKKAKEEYSKCEDFGTNAFLLANELDGLCFQGRNCLMEFCDGPSVLTGGRFNFPEYSISAASVSDVQAGVTFAKDHNIKLSVRTSGHNYMGSNNAIGGLKIFTRNLEKFSSDGLVTHSDSCGTITKDAVKVGGGELWGEVYAAVGETRHIVGGGGLTVSAAGGWLAGSGLSSTSRKYGMGVDNVLDFTVVLANGTLVVADACQNTDLFWALRGGGGGTFGVVTAVHYKTHAIENIVALTLIATQPVEYFETWERLMDFWVDSSPYLDNRWGGYWTGTSLFLTFVGSLRDAEDTFLNNLTAWRNSFDNSAAKSSLYIGIQQHSSYLASRGGVEAMTNPDKTDKTGYAKLDIASRLIPKQHVIDNATEVKQQLKDLIFNAKPMFNYFLGGVMEDISETEMAVHPAMRSAIWQIETFDMAANAFVSNMVSDVPNSGAGLNHGAWNEPQWRGAFWASNYERLVQVKSSVDPDNLFNCYHCVGYQGPEGPENTDAGALKKFSSFNLGPSSKVVSITALLSVLYLRFVL